MCQMLHIETWENGQINQKGQQNPESSGSGYRPKSSLVMGGGILSLNKTQIWVSLLMVVLMIKCLGIMCVKGGHWFTNGCYVGQVASLA